MLVCKLSCDNHCKLHGTNSCFKSRLAYFTPILILYILTSCHGNAFVAIVSPCEGNPPVSGNNFSYARKLRAQFYAISELGNDGKCKEVFFLYHWINSVQQGSIYCIYLCHSFLLAIVGTAIIWICNYAFTYDKHWIFISLYLHIHGLVQEKCNSRALAMELRLSCTKPSACIGCYTPRHIHLT